ncbi:MAG TPA: tail fiber domain-containing protein [Moheibacter sp.]|nr:tail fiber domain-containing protein [Moheibacter sp.]
MKKNVLLLSAFLTVNWAYSQVGIGTDSPNPDALLELNATDTKGGLLLPRVALTATTNAAPLAEHVQGMTLYNTATTTGTNSVTPGYYYNNGTKWIKLEAGSGNEVNNAWSMEGNANTDPKVHFIGTTDGQPLIFKANNEKIGFIGYKNGENIRIGKGAGNDDMPLHGNIAIGESALSVFKPLDNTPGSVAIGRYALGYNTTGDFNLAVGTSALGRNIEGNFNTAVGTQALAGSIKGYNTAVGARALTSNQAGYSTAVGAYALYYNSTGVNTAVGAEALRENRTGNANTATGTGALENNREGNGNTAMGSGAMRQNYYGNENTALGAYALSGGSSQNTAIGYQALSQNSLGDNNTSVGHNSLITNTGGDNNTALGHGADTSEGHFNNATAIGSGAIVNASDKVRIGNTAVTRIEGQVPFTTPSDARFKSNVQQNVPGLAFINQLNPVTYYFDNHKMAQQLNKSATEYNNHATQKIQTGFLAQDVEKAAQALNYDFDGINAPERENDYYTLSYSQFVVPLVQAVKEQQEMIENLLKKVAELEAKINP